MNIGRGKFGESIKYSKVRLHEPGAKTYKKLFYLFKLSQYFSICIFSDKGCKIAGGI